MGSKLEDIDRIMISCKTLQNGDELRMILSKLKKELAQHIIDYYKENCIDEKPQDSTEQPKDSTEQSIEILKKQIPKNTKRKTSQTNRTAK